MSRPEPVHEPVMVQEILAHLGHLRGRTVLDLTIGPGGHALHFLRAGARVVGLDRDPEALQIARQRLAEFGDRLLLIHGRMSRVEELLEQAGVEEVHHCLVDAGLSMDQLRDPARGFSVDSEISLDMRLDRTEEGTRTAYDLVNALLDKQLEQVLAVTGRGREARRVAARIVAARRRHPIRSTAELADLIAAALSRGGAARRIDAAPYLMALRVAVNEELAELEAGIEAATRLLPPTGRLATLTWQGAEHRVARQTLRRLAHPCVCPPSLPCQCGKQPIVRILLRKPLSPTPQEVAANPAARSARLHVVEKI